MRYAFLLAVALLAGCAAPTATAAPYTVPGSVAADCSRDVTADLNGLLGTVPDGSTVQLGAGACYRIDGALRIIDRHNLTVAGNGATFRAVSVPPPDPKIVHQLLLVRGGDHVTIRNLTAVGTNPAPTFDVRREWWPLFQIDGTSDVLLDRVTGRNGWGDFVQVGPDQRTQTDSTGARAVIPARVSVQASSASVIGRHGVSCGGCDDLSITGSTFTDIGYQVLDVEVEGAAWHARDVTFANNTIGGRIALSVLASGDNIGRDVTGVSVTDNRMTASSYTCAPPIEVLDTSTPRSGFTVARNEFATLSNAFRIAGVDDVAVTDNTVSVGNAGCTNPGVAVVVADVTAAILTGNYFPGATRLAVTSGTVQGTFCGNRLSANGPYLPQPCP